MIVMLKKTWPGEFCRSVKAADGQIVERLVFSPGEPQQLTAAQANAVADDLAMGTLVPIHFDAKERVRIGEPVSEAKRPAAKRAPKKPPAKK